jgi:hypothetical protein
MGARVPRSADGASRSLAALALPVVLLVVLLIGLFLVVPDGAIVGCERDGHFHRAGWASCGVAFSNAPYGPLLPRLVAPLVVPMGTPYLAGRIASLIALLSVVLVSFHAGRRLGARRELAALAALLVGLNGPMLFYGSMACSDLPAAALFIGACWLAFQGLREQPRLLWLAGLTLAGACLVRVQYYLPAAIMVALAPLMARGVQARLALPLGFALPVVLELGVGALQHGGLVDAIGLHLGLAAYARNLSRAGDILAEGGGGEVVSLGARLRWSLALVARCTGGLPILGLLGALGLSRRRRWRPALVVLLPALALYLGLAWSHPPPDWGARRFYLFLVPLGTVPAVLLVRALAARWGLPRPLGVAVAVLAVLVSLGLAQWEIRSFRAPELSSLLRNDEGPRGLAGSYERSVVREVARLSAELEPCTPVATNFHPATIPLRNAWFLGDVDLSDPGLSFELEPAGGARQRWLLWVPPDGSSMPKLRPLESLSRPDGALEERP